MQVGTNGIISFSNPWFFWYPETFPTTSFNTREAFVVAPFWADHDIRVEGTVSYKTYSFGDGDSNIMLEYVSSFIRSNRNESFTGQWMLVANWTDVHPYPHGDGADFLSSSLREFVANVSTSHASKEVFVCVRACVRVCITVAEGSSSTHLSLLVVVTMTIPLTQMYWLEIMGGAYMENLSERTSTALRPHKTIGL